jgi:uncharacterized membrane-anchored protein YhcB (DUF1043 family)
MSRRKHLIDTIQALSLDEGTRQPTAADWLADQDKKAKHRREQDPPPGEGRDYQDDVLGDGE